MIEVLYFLVAFAFFIYLFHYYLTTTGGPTLLAFTLVPFTFVLFVLNALRRDELYPRLGTIANFSIAGVYTAICVTISVYMFVEFEELGTVRAGIWDPTDLVLGGLMAALVMEYARKRYFALFILNIILIFYAVYGWIVPGMFYHPGLSWTRIVTSMSLEDTTGVFSSLPQLALTLIGSFVLVLSVLRAFGCIDSILKGSSRIAARSPYALPQAAVIGSFGVASVSGSGATNAVTTGSATIPALINAGMPRANAASVETAASLGGQLMPPIMGISAFLMADFLDRSYFDVVARGYAPALIYFAGVSLGVYLMSVRLGTLKSVATAQPMGWSDWSNVGAFIAVVIGLIGLMAIAHLPPMFAAIDVFVAIGATLFVRFVVVTWHAHGASGLRSLGAPLLRFLDNFTSMTADLTLLLATLSILTSTFVNTGVPTKVGFILVDLAAINLGAVVVVSFLFGAVVGMGLPPAPTYILTALVIAPHMIKAGVDPWPVHFFAFFLAVWGELTPPTSVVAAVTSKIADASFFGTLLRAIQLCVALFVLMAAVFVRPGLVIEPGLTQLAMMFLVLVATVGVTFSLQGHFSTRWGPDLAARVVLAAFALVVLFHPDLRIAALACVPVGLFVASWVLRRRKALRSAQTA
ncbi:MAG: TRAP transporter permease [Candidatus Methylomirabilia bacterium]